MGQSSTYAGSDQPSLAASDERRRVRQAIVQELSMQERLLLVLLYAERMNPEEIAATLNMSPTQVHAARERVVGRLESLMRAA
jgi:RNA polymerase sigma factor (sigma-70 family)